MVWLQGTIGKPLMDRGRTQDNEHRQAAEYALGDPPSHGMRRIIREEALDHVIRQKLGDEVTKAVSVPHLREELARLSQEDQSRLMALADENSKERLESWKPDTREERIESLIRYDVGQQDIGGLPPTSDSHITSLNALWCAMSWASDHALPSPVFAFSRRILCDVELCKHSSRETEHLCTASSASTVGLKPREHTCLTVPSPASTKNSLVFSSALLLKHCLEL